MTKDMATQKSQEAYTALAELRKYKPLVETLKAQLVAKTSEQALESLEFTVKNQSSEVEKLHK